MIVFASTSIRCPASVKFIWCVSRRSSAIPQVSSSARSCRLSVGWDTRIRRAAAEMLRHSTMQRYARRSERSSNAVIHKMYN